MPKSNDQVRQEICRRGLVSLMNDTKWEELKDAVCHELAFTPPYQLKLVLAPLPDPEQFECEEYSLGDWSDECLLPFYEIEWLRVRPRVLLHRGRLIAPEVQSVEPGLLEILRRYHIPYRRDADTIWIYGYASNTNNITLSG